MGGDGHGVPEAHRVPVGAVEVLLVAAARVDAPAGVSCVQ